MRRVRLFLYHLLGSWLVIPFLGAPLIVYLTVAFVQQFYSAVTFKVAHWVLTETPFFPIQIIMGLAYGFVLGRRLQHEIMLSTWVPPALFLAVVVLFVPLPVFDLPSLTPQGISPGLGDILPRLKHFFGRDCLPQNHCLDQLIITMPFYAAAAYSIGALIARRMAPRHAEIAITIGAMSKP